MSERFFQSNRPGYPHPVSWKIVVSEWRSVIAVSLNVGGGVRLIKRQNCACARKTLKTRGRMHGAGFIVQGYINYRLLIKSIFGVFYSYFWAGDSCFFQGFLQIYIMGLLLFLKDVSGTPIFKILVRTLN